MMAIDQAIQTSTVGRYVGTRMDQIEAQVTAELQPEATGLQNDGRALEAKRGTLDAASYQSQAANLNLRLANFQKKQEQRQRELQATEQKAINRIAQELDPIVRAGLPAEAVLDAAEPPGGPGRQPGHGHHAGGDHGA